MSTETMALNSLPRPLILILDDSPEDLRGGIMAELSDRAGYELLHPSEVELQHLKSADLVLVDYRLDHWPERDDQASIALQPTTGIALAGVLHEHVDLSQGDRLTAFALHTGHLEDVRGRVPAARAQHLLARLNNLEWVFPKTEPRRYEQMVLLGQAMKHLPRNWPSDEVESTNEAIRLLEIDTRKPWFDRCWREVRECQLPVHELARGEHGALFVRWLLHLIMPYPTFLWEAHWVAARLRLPVAALRAVAAGESVLAQDLRGMKYSGILANFLGDRWWRGALEDYVWDIAGGGGADARRLTEALTERAGEDLGSIELEPPVVCLGHDLQPTGEFCSPAAAVRLRPEHWPAFADAAWMAVETVQSDAALAAIVDPLDEDRLNERDEG